MFSLQEIDYQKMYLPENVSLYDSTQIMDSNPIKTAIVVCNKLIKEQVSSIWHMTYGLPCTLLQVYAIIVSKPENGELSPASVSYTAGKHWQSDRYRCTEWQICEETDV